MRVRISTSRVKAVTEVIGIPEKRTGFIRSSIADYEISRRPRHRGNPSADSLAMWHAGFFNRRVKRLRHRDHQVLAWACRYGRDGGDLRGMVGADGDDPDARDDAGRPAVPGPG